MHGSKRFWSMRTGLTKPQSLGPHIDGRRNHGAQCQQGKAKTQEEEIRQPFWGVLIPAILRRH